MILTINKARLVTRYSASTIGHIHTNSVLNTKIQTGIIKKISQTTSQYFLLQNVKLTWMMIKQKTAIFRQFSQKFLKRGLNKNCVKSAGITSKRLRIEARPYNKFHVLKLNFKQTVYTIDDKGYIKISKTVRQVFEKLFNAK